MISFPLRFLCVRSIARWYKRAKGLTGGIITGDRIRPGPGPATDVPIRADPALAAVFIRIAQRPKDRGMTIQLHEGSLAYIARLYREKTARLYVPQMRNKYKAVAIVYPGECTTNSIPVSRLCRHPNNARWRGVHSFLFAPLQNDPSIMLGGCCFNIERAVFATSYSQ